MYSSWSKFSLYYIHIFPIREEKKEEVKKTYDWKKGVKKVEKKEVKEEPKPEKFQLKKPKVIEKPKEEAKPGVQLKPTPVKEKPKEEEKEGYKLKPIPAKAKPEEVRPFLIKCSYSFFIDRQNRLHFRNIEFITFNHIIFMIAISPFFVLLLSICFRIQ